MIREGSLKRQKNNANINVKKLQFIQKLTACDTYKTSKMTKKVITHNKKGVTRC